MSSYVYVQEKNRQAVTDFLFTLKEELYLPDKEAAQRITDLLFDHGGVIGGYHRSRLCGVLGYFLGEPGRDFANKEVAFLYVGALTESYRLTRMFHQGLTFTLRTLKQAGVREIRLQAEASNPYTNRLYARFATPLGESESLRGVPVVTYGGAIDDALAYLTRGKRRTRTHHAPAGYAKERTVQAARIGGE